MAPVSEITIGNGGQSGRCEPLRTGARGDCGTQRPLRPGAVAHAHPVPEPAREGFKWARPCQSTSWASPSGAVANAPLLPAVSAQPNTSLSFRGNAVRFLSFGV
jgi:hypothetical protein